MPSARRPEPGRMTGTGERGLANLRFAPTSFAAAHAIVIDPVLIARTVVSG